MGKGGALYASGLAAAYGRLGPGKRVTQRIEADNSDGEWSQTR